jgi:toxin YhaV
VLPARWRGTRWRRKEWRQSNARETLGENRKHWFRAKTGNDRYRLFYRFQSSARIIVYAFLTDQGEIA